jgi:hypothetical protein
MIVENDIYVRNREQEDNVKAIQIHLGAAAVITALGLFTRLLGAPRLVTVIIVLLLAGFFMILYAMEKRS